jgi:hypothetical protein
MVKKIHTRAKRKLGYGTHLPHRARIKGIPRKKGPKTFKTEESAKKYAEENKIKKYELKKVKKDKKFQIVEL